MLAFESKYLISQSTNRHVRPLKQIKHEKIRHNKWNITRLWKKATMRPYKRSQRAGFFPRAALCPPLSWELVFNRFCFLKTFCTSLFQGKFLNHSKKNKWWLLWQGMVGLLGLWIFIFEYYFPRDYLIDLNQNIMYHSLLK